MLRGPSTRWFRAIGVIKTSCVTGVGCERLCRTNKESCQTGMAIIAGLEQVQRVDPIESFRDESIYSTVWLQCVADRDRILSSKSENRELIGGYGATVSGFEDFVINIGMTKG